jgi:2-dehydropantoate 2-reductase
VRRYIIIGAGAVGGTIGARLFEAGHEVVLVARGAHLAALRDRGLRLLSPEAPGRTVPVPAVAGPRELTAQPDDVLVLATKTQHSAAALEPWIGYGHAEAEQVPILLAQNGVANERLALRRFARVYGVGVWLPATHLEPGVVEARGVPLSGILHLGRYPRGADAFIEGVAEDLEKSGFRAPVGDAVMRWKYTKLLSNLANAIEALTGRLESDEAQDLARRARVEATEAFAAAGIEYASDEEQAGYRGLLRIEPVIDGVAQTGGSSWQSLARRSGSVEADYLNGEIVLLGRLHGVPTPINATLQRLAGTAAREGHAPGALSVAELAALLEE